MKAAGYLWICTMIGLGLFAATIVNLAWNDRQSLRKLASHGLETRGLVTSAVMEDEHTRHPKCRIDYDYVAAGAKHHGQFLSETKLGFEASPIDVTYLPDQPAVSVPFAKDELDGSDLGKNRRTHTIGAVMIAAMFSAMVAWLVSIVLLETRLARDGNTALARIVNVSIRVGNQFRLAYVYDTPSGTIRQSEMWAIPGISPRMNEVVPVVYRRKGDRFESRIADNFIFRDPPEPRVISS